MNAQSLRRNMQDDKHLKASDETRWQLVDALKASRQELGGLALMEIAEIMQEVLVDEAAQIKTLLN